jgi:hypothetical protein
MFFKSDPLSAKIAVTSTPDEAAIEAEGPSVYDTTGLTTTFREGTESDAKT